MGGDLFNLWEDDFSDLRRHDSMTPWHCGRGGDGVVLYHFSTMWFPDMEKCKFSGPTLDLMTHSSETD